MTHRLSQTVVLTMLVAGIGMTAHAGNLERSALEAGHQFDLIAQGAHAQNFEQDVRRPRK